MFPRSSRGFQLKLFLWEGGEMAIVRLPLVGEHAGKWSVALTRFTLR